MTNTPRGVIAVATLALALSLGLLALTRQARPDEPNDIGGDVPQARGHFAIAYDAKSGATAMSTGVLANSSGMKFYDDFWTWDGSQWTLQSSPGLRAMGARMAYDSKRGRILLLGGFVDGSGPTGDLRAWTGRGWVTLGSLPGWKGTDVGIAYDSKRDRLVVVAPDITSRTETTYEWDGAKWRNSVPRGLPFLSFASLAFDPSRDVTVLFGGANADGTRSSAVWEYDGIRWTQRPSSGPVARAFADMAYSDSLGTVVMHGGLGADGSHFVDTWTWDGEHWSQLAKDGPNLESGLVYDKGRDRLVLVGSPSHDGSVADMEVWEWVSKKWIRVS